MSQKERVPVLITTLCRYEHFVRCVESLKKNSLAKETELYIGLDYPLYERHRDGYQKISEYLEKLDGFKKVNVIRHEKNVGAAQNAKIIREIAWEKYDRYIVSEDDNEFSECYLEYMNLLMDKYDNDPEVLAVTGYDYPLDTEGISGDIYACEAYFSAFGYGIWKQKRNEYDLKRTYDTFLGYYKDRDRMKRLYKLYPNQFCNFVKGFLGYTNDLIKNGSAPSGDIAYGIYMFFEGKRMIFPVLSKVRNWGYDGSGIHCNDMRNEDNGSRPTYRNFDFSSQSIDMSPVCTALNEIKKDDYEKVIKELNYYFQIGKREKLVSYLTYHFSLLIGVENTKKMIKKLTVKRQ